MCDCSHRNSLDRNSSCKQFVISNWAKVSIKSLLFGLYCQFKILVRLQTKFSAIGLLLRSWEEVYMNYHGKSVSDYGQVMIRKRFSFLMDIAISCFRFLLFWGGVISWWFITNNALILSPNFKWDCKTYSMCM